MLPRLARLRVLAGSAPLDARKGAETCEFRELQDVPVFRAYQWSLTFARGRPRPAVVSVCVTVSIAKKITKIQSD